MKNFTEKEVIKTLEWQRDKNHFYKGMNGLAKHRYALHYGFSTEQVFEEVKQKLSIK